MSDLAGTKPNLKKDSTQGKPTCECRRGVPASPLGGSTVLEADRATTERGAGCAACHLSELPGSWACQVYEYHLSATESELPPPPRGLRGLVTRVRVLSRL